MNASKGSQLSEESVVQRALHDGLTAGGYDVDSLELIRVANNYIYADRTNGNIYRIPVTDRPAGDLTEENRRLSQLAAIGAPILPPSQNRPVELSTGQLATIWPLGGDPDPDPLVSLAPTLRTLHQVEPVNGLPIWEGFERFHRRIEVARSIGVPEPLVDEIDGRLRVLFDSFPAWSTSTVVHGDPHRGNLVKTTDGHLLIDLDDLAVGCAEIDLATVRNGYLRFDGVPGTWASFLEQYGLPLDLDLLSHFVKLRDLTMIAWLFSLWNLRPESQAEAIHRVSTIDQVTVWNAL